MAVIHISEEEATRDFGAVMTRIREGAEVSIDKGDRPVAVMRPADPAPRSIEESIAIGRAREDARGYKAVMTEDFARDLEEIVANRKSTEPVLQRTTAEAIAIGEAREKARGFKAVMDEDFARDLTEIVANRKPANWPEWD
jgi:antitoxin (DNA-binding transcriptional repressor) of toxin-antitoxin stability system